MADDEKSAVLGAEIKVWMENSTLDFSISEEESPFWVKNAFNKFLAEYLREMAFRTDKS